MVDWTRVTVVGVVAALVIFVGFLALRNARRTGKVEAELQAQLAGEKTKAEIVEKSDEAAEAADARRADSLRDVDGDIVRGVTLPDWLKR